MIFIDKPKNGYSHMISDCSIDELHEFAQKIEIKRCWFHNRRGKGRPHYDLKEKYITVAIANGAKIVSTREIFFLLKKTYN